MSKRRKKVRGNPAGESASPRAPRQARGLRAFREAQKRGQDVSARPQRRDDVKPGFLRDANRRAAEGSSSSPQLLLYALLTVMLFLFAYLHLYALPQMNYFAGGFSMPDARLFGYSVAEVERLRNVMGPEGTGQLNFLHKTAGIMFPVSFLLSTWAVVGFIMRPGVFRWTVLGGAVIFAGVDIAENIMIDRILTMDTLDEGLVMVSSTLTVLSWALLLLLGAVVISAVAMNLIRQGVERP